jgi:hypothetical protein
VRLVSRRWTATSWLAVVAVAVVLAGACAPKATDADADATPATSVPPPTTTSTLPPSTTTTITSDPVRRVLILGDSGMVDATPAIRAMFEDAGATVAEGAGPGFGLTRLGTKQPWPPYPEAWTGLVDRFRPDLSVVMLGVWDESYVAEHGVAAYMAMVQDSLSILTSHGGRVLWLGTPPGGEIDLTHINPIYETAAGAHPGVVFYGQVEGSLRGPAGDFPASYTAADGTRVHLRKADGWHFCPDGAAQVAAAVEQIAVRDGLSVPTGDGWRSGSWRTKWNYDEPACSS